MKIQIDGTNTLNKGAELMLVAIIEQIEKLWPTAKVFYNSNYLGEKRVKHNYSIPVRKRRALQYGKYPRFILKKIGLPHTYFSNMYAPKEIQVVLDGAGFQFSDQWNFSKQRLDELEGYYRRLKQNNAKIILLPQAFGPFETDSGKRMINIMNSYVDIIIAREKESYQHLVQSGIIKEKVWQYPDFTITVKGDMPKNLNHLKNKVCIIPNTKMVTHGDSDLSGYLGFLVKTIKLIEEKGYKVFILNHEGQGDLKICEALNSEFSNKFQIISGLTAKQVKGVIGSSYMVVSSRFHGAASALNQGVPCLATSWNHKYQMLFEDFDQKDKILDIQENWQVNKRKIQNTFQSYHEIKKELELKKKEISLQIDNMWINLAKGIYK